MEEKDLSEDRSYSFLHHIVERIILLVTCGTSKVEVRKKSLLVLKITREKRHMLIAYIQILACRQ